jgi:hypothetical protein
LKGSPLFAIEHKQKSWLFSNAQNAELFEQSPVLYEPQFNGWCSYAVSEGYGAEVDFVNGWAVIEDKLYLNWDQETQNLFVSENNRRRVSADRNWKKVHAGMLDGSVELYTYSDEGASISHPQRL